MTATFENRVALVTGAARGMGLATAQRLLDRGARVAVNDVSRDQIESVATTLGSNALAVAADITDRAAVDAMMTKITNHFERIDVLINNNYKPPKVGTRVTHCSYMARLNGMTGITLLDRHCEEQA